MTKLRISGIVEDSIVDGPGLRLAVFVQGCFHGCPGCHNPQTHDPDGGYEVEVDEIVDMARRNKLLRGITITGGEPFEQREACAELAMKAKRLGLDVWVYTGYCFESLLWNGLVKGNRLLLEADVLVDGLYIEDMRSHVLKWRGSKNQRLIDMKATLRGREPVLWEE